VTRFGRTLGWRDRRRRGPVTGGSDLREFVYLDDVSVYSLLASRKGGIATEFTDSEAYSLQSDVGGSVGAGMSGLLRAEASSHLRQTRTQSSQVLRKAIVQTSFKELYDSEQEHLRLRPIASAQTLPPIGLRMLLQAVAATDRLPPWVIPTRSLQRGALAEIEVELSTEPIFRVSAVIASIMEMMDDAEELARTAISSSDLGQVAAMARIIERLLVGLIPIRGRAVDFEVIETQGRELIVHRQLADHWPTNELISRRPLFVVGVAEESLFWKDLRRVLFSNARYRVLCRLSRDGIHPTWTPVKLVEVLKEVAPDLALHLESLATDLTQTTLGSSSESEDAFPHQDDGIPNALLEYATALAEQHGTSLSDDDRLALVSSFPEKVPFETYGERLTALRHIATLVEERCGFALSPEVTVSLRTDYAMAGSLKEFEPPIGTPSDSSRVETRNERYLDVEFVAMYW
jgi:hypothetical protein